MGLSKHFLVESGGSNQTNQVVQHGASLKWIGVELLRKRKDSGRNQENTLLAKYSWGLGSSGWRKSSSLVKSSSSLVGIGRGALYRRLLYCLSNLPLIDLEMGPDDFKFMVVLFNDEKVQVRNKVAINGLITYENDSDTYLAKLYMGEPAGGCHWRTW